MDQRRITRVSVVTVTLNSAATLADTLTSVAQQEGVEVEHIVKDGGSNDGTLALVQDHVGAVRVVRQPDRGIYDAMNQGFAAAAGEIVCFLNSDDYFADAQVLRDVVHAFEATGADIVYGDTEIIDAAGRVVRHWRSGPLKNGRLDGQQLPHPSFFVRREVLNELGAPFDPNYQISADFKQQIILINKLGAKVHYLSRTLVRMRHGGASTRSPLAVVDGWRECMRAYREATGGAGWKFVARKVLRKLPHLRLPGQGH